MPRLLLILPLLLLAGCGTFADPTEWFSDDTDTIEPSELVDLENQVQPEVLWKADIGAGTDEQRLALEPFIVGDTLYVSDAEGRVQARAVEDGEQRWETELDTAVSGGPGVGEGLVLVGTSDAEVIALSIEDGTERWRTRVSSEVLSVPAAAAGVVIVHTVDGKLFGLEATNGKRRWLYEREVPVLTLRGSGSPVISGGIAYVGMAGGRLIALRLDNGNLIWDANVVVPGGRSELERLADIDGDPLVFAGGVFVVTYQGEVAAIGQRSGQIAWRRRMSSYSRMAVDSRGLYVGDAEGVLWGLDLRGGKARWSQDALKHRKLSNLAVIDELVVVGDFEGYLHWLDRGDGSLVARTRIGSDAITTGLKAVDGRLYVQGDGGELAVIRLPEEP